MVAWRRGVDFAGRKACTARRRVMLSVKKSRQKNFGAEFVSAFGGAEILRGAKPVRLPGGGLLLYARVVAGCAPCRVTQLTLGVTLQRSAAPPFPSGPCVPPGAPYQNTLGAVPQDPLTLKLRLDTDWTFQLPLKSRSVQRRRYALRVPAAHFILAPSRDRIKINTL